MKINQVREMTDEDLKTALKDNHEALQNFRFQLATGQLENYKSLSATRKTIARIYTIMKEKAASVNAGKEKSS